MKSFRSTKYHNSKAIYDGIVFDSKKEMNRYIELTLLQRAGEIHDLERQKVFPLIPKQKMGGKVLERECTYKADFVYRDKDGALVVEDVKGMKTEVYKIKRKLMLYIHNIRVKEI